MLSATAGRRTAERNSLTDTCTITRDPQGAEDDHFDEQMLAFAPPDADDATVIWGTGIDGDDGRCSLSPMANLSQQAEQGGQTLYDGDYLLRLPMTAPIVQPGDMVNLLTSKSDPHLIGPTYFVEEELGSSRGVLRRIRCTTRRRGPAY